MNARERLKDLLGFMDRQPKDDENSRKDAAALRELDKLLEDMTKFVKQRVNGEARALEHRAAQAGYGEK